MLHQGLYSANIDLTPNRDIIVNGKKRPGKVSKFVTAKDSTYIFTFKSGLIKITSKGIKTLPTPITPVFNHSRQLEDGDFSQNAPLVITRNKLVKITGKNYVYQDLKGVRKGSRLTAIAYFKNKLFLGTSYNGVYIKSTNGWKRISAGIPREKYSWGEYFYDDIKALFSSGERLYAHCDHSRSLYRFLENKSRWVKTKITGVDEVIKGSRIYFRSKNRWHKFYDENKTPEIPISKKSEIRDHKITSLASFNQKYPFKNIEHYGEIRKDIKSLFINLDFITFGEMDVITNLLVKGVVNAVVINFKDDTGNLIYGSKLPLAKDIGSTMLHYKFKHLYKRLKPINPYVIARLVVFKDYRLYKYKNHLYALRDKRDGKPWRVNGHEYWVDPFSQDVQHYNLSVAKELQARKEEFLLNEIQFDYIRFPSDKAIRYVDFRSRQKDWERYDILESYLSKVAKALSMPFSLDIYGYNGIYRMGNVIGQDIETISKYAPIICPMHYPSHFGRVYLSSRNGSWEYNLLNFALKRAVRIVHQDTIIRPYLQVFTYRAKNFGEQYIRDQVKGSLDGGARGVGFWHPSSKYSKVAGYLQRIFKDN